MSQAEKIRDIVINILKFDRFEKKITEEMIINNEKVNGIKYTRLKEYLMENYSDFSEGAITGALQTLTQRVDNVFKTKTKKGVYFFYSEVEYDDLELGKEKVIITESEDYRDLEVAVNNVSSVVGQILRNAVKNQYLDVRESDVNSLRDILEASGKLELILKNYKQTDALGRIERDDVLPF